MIVAPGSTIGIIGGGQLGRMIALAAAPLGYRCHILDPHAAPCAAAVAANFTRAAFDDVEALRRFAKGCDVVTYEFENLPTGPLDAIGDTLHPGTESLRVAQDRAVEKAFVERIGGRPAPWRPINGPEDIADALSTLGAVVLKTRRLGYDGKGQVRCVPGDDPAAAWSGLGARPAVAEALIDFDLEFSIVIARGRDGATAAYPATQNRHDGGILRHSVVPADPRFADQYSEGEAIATRLITALDHVGVLTVEFFATADGPLVNEFAPRVHNSGHWTIEGAVTSQFEQHVRAICGLPLGPTAIVALGATMDNLIGDDVDAWADLVAEPGAHLHLYDKGEARPGRKMGHVTRVTV